MATWWPWVKSESRHSPAVVDAQKKAILNLSSSLRVPCLDLMIRNWQSLFVRSLHRSWIVQKIRTKTTHMMKVSTQSTRCLRKKLSLLGLRKSKSDHSERFQSNSRSHSYRYLSYLRWLVKEVSQTVMLGNRWASSKTQSVLESKIRRSESISQ